MAITSPYPDVDILDTSIYEFIFGTLNDDDADLVALIDGPTGGSTTFGALRAQADGYAGGLAARGVSVGDVVALHAPNLPAFVAVFHGILRAGATATTVNSLYTPGDIAKQRTSPSIPPPMWRSSRTRLAPPAHPRA